MEFIKFENQPTYVRIRYGVKVYDIESEWVHVYEWAVLTFGANFKYGKSKSNNTVFYWCWFDSKESRDWFILRWS